MQNALYVSLVLFVTLALPGCTAMSGSGEKGSLPSQGGSVAGAASARAGVAHLGWLSPQAKKGKQLLYVADQAGQTVYIYPQGVVDPKPIGAITQGIAAPEGLFVDKKGALYVCNFGAGTVTVYPQGSTSPSKTLTKAGAAPLDVVAGNDGTVYVSDFNAGQNGHVFEYANGSTTPTTTIHLSAYPEGVALDRNNNLYVAYQKSATAGTVLTFKPGSTTPKDLGLKIRLVGGAAIDEKDNLLVVDQSNPSPHVDVFPPGSKTRSEKIGGFSLAFDIALNHRNNHLYVTRNQNPALVYEVSYPGGSPIQTITNSLQTVTGVATSPDGAP